MTDAEHITGARNTIDPTKITTLSGIFSELNRISALNMQCNIPAIVVNYDRKTHIATVRPLIKLPYNDIGNKEQSIEMPKMKVTVWRMSFGGFLFDMPLFPGDTGWLVASDWNTSLVKKENSFGAESNSTKNNGPKKPETYELHRYKNGFFIPDRWGEIDIGESDSNSIVIKSLIGDTLISIGHNGNILIKNPNKESSVYIEGNLRVTGVINGDTGLSTSGTLSVGGNADITGTSSAGTISSKGEIIALSETSPVSLGSHVHIGNLGVETSAPKTGSGEQTEPSVLLIATSSKDVYAARFSVNNKGTTVAHVGNIVTLEVCYPGAGGTTNRPYNYYIATNTGKEYNGKGSTSFGSSWSSLKSFTIEQGTSLITAIVGA